MENVNEAPHTGKILCAHSNFLIILISGERFNTTWKPLIKERNHKVISTNLSYKMEKLGETCLRSQSWLPASQHQHATPCVLTKPQFLLSRACDPPPQGTSTYRSPQECLLGAFCMCRVALVGCLMWLYKDLHVFLYFSERGIKHARNDLGSGWGRSHMTT